MLDNSLMYNSRFVIEELSRSKTFSKQVMDFIGGGGGGGFFVGIAPSFSSFLLASEMKKIMIIISVFHHKFYYQCVTKLFL